jgi:flagellar hook-length control protein FliK
MNARLIVSEDAARAVVERHLVELRHTLEDNGITLNDLNVASREEQSNPQTTWQRDESQMGRPIQRNEVSQDVVSSHPAGTIDVRV